MNPVIQKQKPVWVTETNSDMTEGRGHTIIVGVSETPETAHRIGFKKYVMGTNCPVRQGMAYFIDNQWYIPGEVIQESKEDTQQRLLREEREAIEAKAKMLGLTDDEIKIMQGKK